MMNAFLNFKIKRNVAFVVFLFVSLLSFGHGKLCSNHNKLDFVEAFFCDLCGCATSSGSFGQGTLNNTSFIGVRYISQKFISKDGIFDNSPTSTENFNTYQLWARVPISEKIYVSTVLPYQDLKRAFTDRDENINGLGDATVMGWYRIQFYIKKPNPNSEYTTVTKEPSGHSIELGLGTKLPTGNFEQVLADNVNPSFQLGTGSLDGIFSVAHNYGSDKFGVNTNVTYYAKGENKNEYKFGNQFSFASNLFFSVPKKKFNLMPFIGFSGNIYNKIEQFGEEIANTDGTVFNGTFGTEIIVKNLIFGANYTLPISHNLFGGNVTPRQSLTLYMNFSLNKK